MNARSVLIAAVLLCAGAGGLVLAQEGQSVERSAAPPAEGPPPPPLEPAPPLPGATAPDEAAPPPEAPDEAAATAPSEPAAPPPVATQNRAAAAAASNSVAEEEPPPPPPPPPLKRPRFTTAILQAVDKSSGETLRFEAKVGQPIRYKGLTMAVHACETTAADADFDGAFAHLEVSSQPQTVAGRPAAAARQVFRGWMFSESQSIHPLEHPLYDLWLIACKTEAPAAPGASL